MEVDGADIPPTEIREQIIRADGLWEVYLPHAKVVSRSVQVIRDVLSLDLKVALALVKDASSPIYVGTEVEATWLSTLLSQAGEIADLKRIE